MDYTKDKARRKEDSRFVYLPIIGEEETFTIRKITKRTDGDKKFHFIKKTSAEVDGEEVMIEKNLGYHYECLLSNNKILSINNIFAWDNIFVNNDVQENDTIKVQHPEKGIWVADKIVELETKFPEKVEDLDNPPF